MVLLIGLGLVVVIAKETILPSMGGNGNGNGASNQGVDVSQLADGDDISDYELFG